MAKLDVTSHLEDLWRYARVLTRNDADADDLVQEALVRALGFASSYDRARPLLPWLLKIVRNTFLAGQTRVHLERERLRNLAVLVHGQSLPSQEHGAELINVQQALSAMPAEQGEVLHLVGVLGFTYADAAEVLCVPPGTIMSRLSRARSALREFLEDAGTLSHSRLRIVGDRHGAR